APSARPRHRRRIGAEPGPHFVHDAGDLSHVRADRRALRRLRRIPRDRDGNAVNNNFSSLFIGRPVATTLLTIGIALAGAFAFGLLPVSPLPQVDFPTISVQAAM